MSDKSELTMTNLSNMRKKDAGQTLVIAVVILGILLIVGFAFAGIVSKNISEADRSKRRNLATDLARSGADLAHYNLRYSALGADWRPSPTPPEMDANGFTKDPDALYLRPADPNLPFSSEARLAPIPDRGGPDGYGPYSRVFFDKGRALIRIQFNPFAYDAFRAPNGQLRDPGKARNYLTIEVIGRPAALRSGNRIDPSLQLPERVRVRNFADITDKTNEIARLKSLDNTLTNTRKLMAFASIGIIEHLRYITDKAKVSRAAELGFPTGRESGNNLTPFDQANVGITYGDGQAPFANNPDDNRPVAGISFYGQIFGEPNNGAGNLWQTITGLGSLYSNVGLKLHGLHRVALNATFNEAWTVAGAIQQANSESALSVTRAYLDKPTGFWNSDVTVDGTVIGSTVNTPVVVSGVGLDSTQPTFNTIANAVRDSAVTPDPDGYPRGAVRKEPPSILTVDPQNRQDRYLVQTRESGRVQNNRNTGRWGLGQGIYVDSSERGNSDSEDQRAITGAVKALPNDWLNPNNPASQGWKGPYYVPIASYLRLRPDGFEIIRDNRSRSAYWRNANGAVTNNPRARFRIRTVENPAGSGKFQAMSLNSIEHANLVGQPALSLSDDSFRQFGQPFNGLIYFEGDVRVRGVIPTDQQITVISKGSIYVEGSVVKGLITEQGTPITRPSRSTIMLAARDFVCVNTTMFFAPSPGETVHEKNENAVPDTPNPLELSLDYPSIQLEGQFLLDSATVGGNPNNPSTWLPYALRYETGGVPIASNLLVSTSADDNGPTFVSLDVAPGSYALVGSWASYLFPRDLVFGGNPTRFNAAAEYFTGNGNVPVYGMGNPTINAYPRFETVEFQIVNSTFTYNQQRMLPANNTLGAYALAVQDPTYFRVRMNGLGNVPMKNFLAARTAVAPFDVRIEAAMFAEEGSFFVIPGNWFNNNSQDSRRNWLDRSANGIYPGMSDDQANERRFELFGHTPSVPFYGEPLDVKISILGAISENLPAPISAQAEWLRKWGWIPRLIGSSGQRIPTSHTSGFDPNVVPALPNLTMSYDPVFGSASVFDQATSTSIPVRTDENGAILPPMPRLPVSPTLAYYGEVNP